MSNAIETLVVNRTVADNARFVELGEKLDKGTATLEEIQEWINNPLRGTYNYTDLNRVSSAMQYLSTRFVDYGYISEVHSTPEWAMESIPTVSDMDVYLADLRHLRGILEVFKDTPPAPADMEKLFWHEANDIEKILLDIEQLLNNIQAAWYYSGDLFSGEV